MGTDAPSPEPLSSVRPPLRILFTIDYGRKVNFLPLSRGGRLYVGFPDATRALDERTAEKLWENEEIESPLLFAEGKLVGQRRTGLDRQVLEVVDPDTGRVERTLVDWPAVSDLTPAGGLLACVKYDDTVTVCGVEFASGRVRWRWPVPEGAFIAARLAGDAEQAYVCLDDGFVVALDARTGRRAVSTPRARRVAGSHAAGCHRRHRRRQRCFDR